MTPPRSRWPLAQARAGCYNRGIIETEGAMDDAKLKQGLSRVRSGLNLSVLSPFLILFAPNQVFWPVARLLLALPLITAYGLSICRRAAPQVGRRPATVAWISVIVAVVLGLGCSLVPVERSTEQWIWKVFGLAVVLYVLFFLTLLEFLAALAGKLEAPELASRALRLRMVPILVPVVLGLQGMLEVDLNVRFLTLIATGLVFWGFLTSILGLFSSRIDIRASEKGSPSGY